MMVPSISVVICTYNPRADHLRRVLNSLKQQSLPQSKWELLLIDNASQLKLEDVWDLSWHTQSRHIRENDLGLTAARIRGIKESTGDLIIFVDDDNVLQDDYLNVAFDIYSNWPTLGAWGGQQIPEFENGSPAEKWKTEFWTSALVRDVWSNNYDRQTAPVGAGLCIRRTVAQRYMELCVSNSIRHNLDRKGSGLNSAGDIDMAFVACDLGFGTGRFKKLYLIHLIPSNRTEDSYLRKLIEGFGYSSVVLDSLRGEKPCLPCRIDRLVYAYKQLRLSKWNKLFSRAYETGRRKAILDLKG